MFFKNKKTLEMLKSTPTNLVGNSKNYKKYIILAHHRSGSSLIVKSLRKHPQVISFGELFNHTRIAFNVERYNNYSKDLLKFRKEYPSEFLNKFIFSSYVEDKTAVGFKLFPIQIENKPYSQVWDWLKKNKDVLTLLSS